MDKLEAIRKIVYTDGAIDSMKVAGIQLILESEESSAESIATAFSESREESLKRLKG